uniref:Uncharacterized protein n=1 Tax=Caenorhabditis japonica TaxID=281687 RepID=A0A8R1HXI3_CAEJA
MVRGLSGRVTSRIQTWKRMRRQYSSRLADSIEQVKSELFDLYNQKINVYEKSHNEKPRELSWYKCYDTSCKDLPTLYEAWSDISQWTIRRQEEIQDKLKILLKTMDVTCLLLIERRTFLVLAYAETESKHSITDYYLRMIKDLLDLKPLINGTDNNDGRHILRDKYQAYVADFTLNTYLVVVTEDMTIQPNFIKLNPQMGFGCRYAHRNPQISFNTSIVLDPVQQAEVSDRENRTASVHQRLYQLREHIREMNVQLDANPPKPPGTRVFANFPRLPVQLAFRLGMAPLDTQNPNPYAHLNVEQLRERIRTDGFDPLMVPRLIPVAFHAYPPMLFTEWKALNQSGSYRMGAFVVSTTGNAYHMPPWSGEGIVPKDIAPLVLPYTIEAPMLLEWPTDNDPITSQ